MMSRAVLPFPSLKGCHGVQPAPRRAVPPEKGFHLFEHALRHRGSDQFGTQGISASRENPFAQRMVRVGLAQESAADILGQIDRF